MSDISEPLNDYFSEKKALIEKSIESIIPVECTYESMNHIAGKVDLEWDYSTLQRTFFDIVHKYLDKRIEKQVCLDVCIFLEAAGKELEKYIPLLGLPAFFETSNEIFQDIINWTNRLDYESGGISSVDLSIAGNVSIALLTLPSHNLIFNRLEIDAGKLLKVYESFTANIFYSLLGNGMKLFWEQLKKIPLDLKEYYGTASLLKRGFLKFAADLWVLFNEKHCNENVVAALNKYIESRTIAIQIERDLLSFERMQAGFNKNKTNHFNPYSNFLFIHAASKSYDTSIPQERLTDEHVTNLIFRTESVDHAENQINEFKRTSVNYLENIPIERRYKELLESYCDYIAHN